MFPLLGHSYCQWGEEGSALWADSVALRWPLEQLRDIGLGDEVCWLSTAVFLGGHQKGDVFTLREWLAGFFTSQNGSFFSLRLGLAHEVRN